MKIQIDYIPISEILPYKNNPRKNDKATKKVAESIAEFGFKNPIILDKNNEIIAGHTRLKSIPIVREILTKKISEEKTKNNLEKVSELQERLTELNELPVIWAEDLTEDQVKAFRIADNKTQEYSDWDLELLKEEFYALEGTESFEFTGFDSNEISKIWDKEENESEFLSQEKITKFNHTCPKCGHTFEEVKQSKKEFNQLN
jgi:hypothetical protein